jgi:hypothetical protein
MDMKEARTTLRSSIRPSELCSVQEAAVRARINVFTIWRWIRERRIRAYGRPGCLRVCVADLLPEYNPSADQRRQREAKGSDQ